MRAFYQSDTDEDACECICGKSMRLFIPNNAPPMPPMIGGALPPINQLQGFCSICRVQLLPTNYAYECNAKSDKHPNLPYQICSRCARYSMQQSHKRHRDYYSQPPPHNNNQYQWGAPPPPRNNNQFSWGAPPPPPPNYINYIPPHQRYNIHAPPAPKAAAIRAYTSMSQFNRFLNTKNKRKHYQQVHQLVNQASASAITSIFDQITRLSDKKKRHLLHTIYDAFDAETVAKYDCFGSDIDDMVEEHDIDTMMIGPSRLNIENKVSIMEDVQKHIIMGDNEFDLNLIAGNVNVEYENDDDFLLKNAHLFEQQQNEMMRIKMVQSVQADIIRVDEVKVADNIVNAIADNIDDGNEQVLALSSQSNVANMDGIDVAVAGTNDINPFLVDNESNDPVDSVEDNPLTEALDGNENESKTCSETLRLAAESVKKYLEAQKMNLNENMDRNDTQVIKPDNNATKPDSNEMLISGINDNVIDTDDDVDLNGIEFGTKQAMIDLDVNDSTDNEEEMDEKLDELNGDFKYDINAEDEWECGSSEDDRFLKTGDLRMAELEDLFGCTIGDNLTCELGQDLWWYRIFIYLPENQLSSIMLTCRYFYCMFVYHQLINDHIINISSLPALVWKLTIFKDFKIEEKFNSYSLKKKCIKYIRIRFIKSMDWNAKLSPKYLGKLNLICLPDIKQLYIEYLSINSNNFTSIFNKMCNMMFCELFANVKSINYIQLINKTEPKQDFTWKLQSFNHVISSLNNFNRLRIPCWNQNIFNPKIYSLKYDSFNFNTVRNIEYIYLSDMRFDNFSSLLPNDNAGIEAVSYFQQLQKLKGIILIFGEDPTKKHQEMISVSESIISLLEMLCDSIQYLIIGVNKLDEILHNPFIETNAQYNDYMAMDDMNILPECYKLYEFNYAFKQEINKIFWTDYVNPDEKYKDEKKIDILKQREEKQKALQDVIKNMIQFEIKNQAPKAQQLMNVDIGDDEDNEDEDDYSSSSSSHSIDNAHYYMARGDVTDDDEDEKDEKENKIHKLQDLGDKLASYNEQKNRSKYKAREGRTAFIVIYNTQIYIEQDAVFGANDNRIPINKDAAGQWQCPFCTVWNARHSTRCEMCRKKKTRYIPQQVLMQQQQIEQQKQYRNMANMVGYNDDAVLGGHGWKCPVCQAGNDDNDKNCKLCTLERPI